MPDSAVEKNTQPAPASTALPAQPAPEPRQSVPGVEHAGVYAGFHEIAAASAGQEPPPESFSPFFRKAEFAHPANDAQKARALGALQEQYGNRYVQRVLAPGVSGKSSAEATPAVCVYRHDAGGAFAAPPLNVSAVASQLESSSGHGLNDDTQHFMSSRFGHDFDNV